MSSELLGALRDAIGADHVLVDADLRAGYERDWTGRWGGPALAVARPASVDEVAAVVRACARAGAAIVTQGGNTGLVGGGVPRARLDRPQVVLSTRRLDAIEPVDTATAQLRAGAGTTLTAARRAARRAGLELALDLAARDTATLGGLAACDAGGLRALRHGTARRQLTGVRAVLADGTVVGRTDGPVKDTAGYDLGALMVGSEGTLGIVCELRWALAPRRDARAVALVGVDSVAAAVALAGALVPALASLELCEVMGRDGVALAARFTGVSVPEPATSPVSVLLECAASADPGDELSAALDRARVGERTVLAADAAGAARLLALREAHADAIADAGTPVKFDVALAPARLAEFCERLGGVVREVDTAAQVISFGHLGDGNLHVNVIGAAAEREGALDDAVLGLAADCGGTVAAEHGIGVHKRAQLALVRGADELATMRALKRTLDPGDLLNPGAAI